MVRTDPYTPSTYRLECQSCLTVLSAEGRLGHCPECGGRLRNLAVPREWGDHRRFSHISGIGPMNGQ